MTTGRARMEHFSGHHFDHQYQNLGQADFELRCDRARKHVSLFIDGRFITQWTDRDAYFAPGSRLLFAPADTSSPCRLSHLTVTSWEGGPDSALSMQHPRRDTVLLVNETDRLSGTVESLENDTLTLASPYARLTFPLKKIADIRFAHRKKPSPPPNPKTKRNPPSSTSPPPAHLTVTLLPSDSAHPGKIRARHPDLGELLIDPAQITPPPLHPRRRSLRKLAGGIVPIDY